MPPMASPPEQFIIVPFKLVQACLTSPVLLTTVVVHPPRAIVSYAL